MAKKSILSANQKKILAIISENKEIGRNFYLTGGTALAEYYLQHRLSEDLDFFSEKEVDSQTVYIFLKSIAWILPSISCSRFTKNRVRAIS